MQEFVLIKTSFLCILNHYTPVKQIKAMRIVRSKKLNEIVLGIDVGGSTTKIVGIKDNINFGMLQVRAADQVTSMYGAIGNLLSKHDIALSDVAAIYLTGVGASFINEQIYGIKTYKIAEFEAIGRGGLAMAGFNQALVVSMGTGTAFVKAEKFENTGDSVNGSQDTIIVTHLGGSGVGGGTIIGLASQMLDKRDVDAILALADKGDLKNIDLSVSDILNSEVNSLPFNLTASNFGKIRSTASDSDIALGIINMVFETAGMLAVFALRNETIKDVIITGSLAEFPQAKTIFTQFTSITGINFLIPDNAVYATALGATMS